MSNPLTDWFDGLLSKAEAEVKKLAGEAEAAGAAFLAGIPAIVATDGPPLAEGIGEVAIGYVLQNESMEADGLTKFSEAVTHTIQDLEALGKSVLPSQAQFAVQAAYYAVRVAKGKAVAKG